MSNKMPMESALPDEAPVAYVKLYMMTGGVLLAAEAAWLGLVAGPLFQNEVGHLVRETFLPAPAVAFYVIYIAGILVFAVLPGLRARRLHRAVALGGFLGLLAYSTFDLTSMAVFRDFPLRLALTDIAWGTFVTGTVSAAGYGMGRRLGLA
jgi:uncharacterized membrane protein